MTGDDEVVRTTRELTLAEQRDMVGQCSRCVLRDVAWWIVPAVLAGVLVALVRGGPVVAGVVSVLVAGIVVSVLQVVAVRRALRSAYPVGMSVETVVRPHHLEHLMGSLALPGVTGVRREGRLFRIDFGKDHSHVLPGHVDVELVRRRAGVAAPTPVPGPGVGVVPPGLGARAARRVLLWRVVHHDALLFWVMGLVLAALGALPVAAFVLVGQAGSLVVAAVVHRREFDRAFPAGVPVAALWRGWTLDVRSARGHTEIDVQQAASATDAGDLFVVRRTGATPLVLPSVVVSDEVRAELLRGN